MFTWFRRIWVVCRRQRLWVPKGYNFSSHTPVLEDKSAPNFIRTRLHTLPIFPRYFSKERADLKKQIERLQKELHQEDKVQHRSGSQFDSNLQNGMKRDEISQRKDRLRILNMPIEQAKKRHESTKAEYEAMAKKAEKVKTVVINSTGLYLAKLRQFCEEFGLGGGKDLAFEARAADVVYRFLVLGEDLEGNGGVSPAPPMSGGQVVASSFSEKFSLFKRSSAEAPATTPGGEQEPTSSALVPANGPRAPPLRGGGENSLRWTIELQKRSKLPHIQYFKASKTARTQLLVQAANAKLKYAEDSTQGLPDVRKLDIFQEVVDMFAVAGDNRVAQVCSPWPATIGWGRR